MAYKLDKPSFFLGMIEAFSEMVMQELKDLAFGPAMDRKLWLEIREDALAIFEKFGVHYYEETSLINTDIAPREAIQGKLIPLIYHREEVFRSYQALKDRVEELEARGLYNEERQREASIALRRLLGYSERAIAEARPASYDY